MSNSVVRALAILDLLARSDKPLPLTQIGQLLDIPKSTAHNILQDLARESFLTVHDPASYSIGLKAFEVGSAYLQQIGPSGVITGELVRLTRILSVTSHYAVLDRADAVYLYKEDPPGLGVQLASSVGARLPAALTAVGKACLAWLEPDETTRELQIVRDQGYASDEGATASGIQCIAAPVFDLSGAAGAIGVSYLLGSSTSVADIATEVMAAAARASALLGGTVRR